MNTQRISISIARDNMWLLPFSRQELREVLLHMLGAAKVTYMQLEVFVLRDAAMAAANLRCMGCQGSTNVLSFPAAQADVASLLLSADAVHRECLLYGQGLVEHTLHLLAHGMGHLLGFEHGQQMDALCQKMWDAAYFG